MKLAIFGFWMFVAPLLSQQTQPVLEQPDCALSFSLTATGRFQPNGYSNANKGCVLWMLTYQSTGFSALSLEVDSAPDSSGVAGSWGAFSGAILDGNSSSAASGPGVNPNTATDWAFLMLKGSVAWISVNLTSKTGTGTIKGNLLGWRPRGNSDTAGSVTPSGPCGGDLAGTFPNCTVAKINTNPLGSTTPTSGNILIGSGTDWVTRALSGDCTISNTGAITCLGSEIWQRSSGVISPVVPTDSLAIGAMVLGGNNSTAVMQPPPFYLTPANTGATAYSYRLVACQNVSCSIHSQASDTISITNGATPLSVTNINYIAAIGIGVIGSDHCDVYRTAGGGTQGKIGTMSCNGTLNDTGLAGDSSTPPSANNSGASNLTATQLPYMYLGRPPSNTSPTFFMEDALGPATTERIFGIWNNRSDAPGWAVSVQHDGGVVFRDYTIMADSVGACPGAGFTTCINSDQSPSGAYTLTVSNDSANSHDPMAIATMTTDRTWDTATIRWRFAKSGLLAFGDKVVGVPALKPNGAMLEVRKGDDSGFASAHMSQITTDDGAYLNGGAWLGATTFVGFLGRSIFLSPSDGVFQAVSSDFSTPALIKQGGGSANHAMCWKADGVSPGYCSDAVSVTGTCTCN